MSCRLRAALFGDSITEFWQGLRPSFWSPDWFNAGIAGEVTGQILARLRRYEPAAPLDLIHILAGTNDVAENSGAITDSQILRNLEQAITCALAIAPRVIVGTIPPASCFWWAPHIVPMPRIRALNKVIRGLTGSGIDIADYYERLLTEAGEPDLALLPDGVHPGVQGYIAMEASLCIFEF